MNIIKDGNKKVKHFTCGNCGCVFEANFGEYQVHVHTGYDLFFGSYIQYRCACPTCNYMCFEEEPIDEQMIQQ